MATFSGKDIRPTPDRVREALFSILTSRLATFDRLKVLELFAGSGAQSLEALSRGAETAVLIDSGRDALVTATENIKRCRFERQARLIGQDVYRALPQLVASGPFDLIFLDPPYRQGHLIRVIKEIDSLNLLSENGILCAEAAKGEDSGHYSTLVLQDTRTYGSTQIFLFGHPED